METTTPVVYPHGLLSDFDAVLFFLLRSLADSILFHSYVLECGETVHLVERLLADPFGFAEDSPEKFLEILFLVVLTIIYVANMATSAPVIQPHGLPSDFLGNLKNTAAIAFAIWVRLDLVIQLYVDPVGFALFSPWKFTVTVAKLLKIGAFHKMVLVGAPDFLFGFAIVMVLMILVKKVLVRITKISNMATSGPVVQAYGLPSDFVGLSIIIAAISFAIGVWLDLLVLRLLADPVGFALGSPWKFLEASVPVVKLVKIKAMASWLKLEFSQAFLFGAAFAFVRAVLEFGMASV
jgi:hypothetical protein